MPTVKVEQLTQEELKRTIHYDPDTGYFTRLSTGKRIGTMVRTEYIEIRINNINHKAHRLAFLYMTGKYPEYADHKDGNTRNNKWLNLREADHGLNSRNRKKHDNNTSGYRNVSFRKNRKTWQASVGYNGKRHYLGNFLTKELAISAVEQFNSKIGGQQWLR